MLNRPHICACALTSPSLCAQALAQLLSSDVALPLLSAVRGAAEKIACEAGLAALSAPPIRPGAGGLDSAQRRRPSSGLAVELWPPAALPLPEARAAGQQRDTDLPSAAPPPAAMVRIAAGQLASPAQDERLHTQVSGQAGPSRRATQREPLTDLLSLAARQYRSEWSRQERIRAAAAAVMSHSGAAREASRSGQHGSALMSLPKALLRTRSAAQPHSPGEELLVRLLVQEASTSARAQREGNSRGLEGRLEHLLSVARAVVAPLPPAASHEEASAVRSYVTGQRRAISLQQRVSALSLCVSELEEEVEGLEGRGWLEEDWPSAAGALRGDVSLAAGGGAWSDGEASEGSEGGTGARLGVPARVLGSSRNSSAGGESEWDWPQPGPVDLRRLGAPIRSSAQGRVEPDSAQREGGEAVEPPLRAHHGLLASALGSLKLLLQAGKAPSGAAFQQLLQPPTPWVPDLVATSVQLPTVGPEGGASLVRGLAAARRDAPPVAGAQDAPVGEPARVGPSGGFGVADAVHALLDELGYELASFIGAAPSAPGAPRHERAAQGIDADVLPPARDSSAALRRPLDLEERNATLAHSRGDGAQQRRAALLTDATDALACLAQAPSILQGAGAPDGLRAPAKDRRVQDMWLDLAPALLHAVAARSLSTLQLVALAERLEALGVRLQPRPPRGEGNASRAVADVEPAAAFSGDIQAVQDRLIRLVGQQLVSGLLLLVEPHSVGAEPLPALTGGGEVPHASGPSGSAGEPGSAAARAAVSAAGEALPLYERAYKAMGALGLPASEPLAAAFAPQLDTDRLRQLLAQLRQMSHRAPPGPAAEAAVSLRRLRALRSELLRVLLLASAEEQVRDRACALWARVLARARRQRQVSPCAQCRRAGTPATPGTVRSMSLDPEHQRRSPWHHTCYSVSCPSRLVCAARRFPASPSAARGPHRDHRSRSGPSRCGWSGRGRC